MLSTECVCNRAALCILSSDDTVPGDIRQPYDYVHGLPFPPLEDKQLFLFLLYLQLKYVTDY